MCECVLCQRVQIAPFFKLKGGHMSVYNRKGGSGKSGTLREQFNYYKRQLQNRLIQEQAFKEARGIGTIEARVYTLFKNLNYDQVYKQGITRKVGYKTIRFIGDEAVKIQIASIRKRASKSYQTDLFIDNYLTAMEGVGFDDRFIDEAERLLSSISIDKLTLIIDKGILPSIQYLYAEVISQEEIMQEIKDAVKSGVTKEELEAVKKRRKELAKVIKEKAKILGW